MRRVKAITHDGSSHILELPLNLDPHSFVRMLYIGRMPGMSGLTPPPVRKEGGGWIYADEIRHAEVIVEGEDFSIVRDVQIRTTGS